MMAMEYVVHVEYQYDHRQAKYITQVEVHPKTTMKIYM